MTSGGNSTSSARDRELLHVPWAFGSIGWSGRNQTLKGCVLLASFERAPCSESVGHGEANFNRTVPDRPARAAACRRQDYYVTDNATTLVIAAKPLPGPPARTLKLGKPRWRPRSASAVRLVSRRRRCYARGFRGQSCSAAHFSVSRKLAKTG
jgi:hypothetical protein